MLITTPLFLKQTKFILWVDKEGYPIARFSNLFSFMKWKGWNDVDGDVFYVEEVDWLSKFMNSERHMKMYEIVIKDAVWNKHNCRIVVWKEDGDILFIANNYHEYNQQLRPYIPGKSVYTLMYADSYSYQYEDVKLKDEGIVVYNNPRNEARLLDSEVGKIYVSCHLQFHNVLPALNHHFPKGNNANFYREAQGNAVAAITYLPHYIYLDRYTVLKDLPLSDFTYENIVNELRQFKYSHLLKDKKIIRDEGNTVKFDDCRHLALYPRDYISTL
jgi:hypothetical protein